MDTQKYNIGWALLTIEGLISNETAKIKRFILKNGAHKLAPKTYALSCVKGQSGMENLVAEIRALGTKETSVRAIFITRAQWSRSFMVHGVSAN